MAFDLYTIDWTAIGSLVTFVAMLIAYWNIHISDKQNKNNQQFQLTLIQREIEQKRLDELIESIIIINDTIQPVDVLDYSVKFVNGNFTETDRHIINSMATKEKSDSNRLTIQLMKYDKYQSAKDVLTALSNMRQKYGEWVRDISILNMYKKHNFVDPSYLAEMTSTMIRISKELEPKLEEPIRKILNTPTDDLNKAIRLLEVFSSVVSSYLIDHKKIFENELYAFVQKEQKRIDDMMFTTLPNKNKRKAKWKDGQNIK